MTDVNKNPCEDLPSPPPDDSCPDGLVKDENGNCIDPNRLPSATEEPPAQQAEEQDEFPSNTQRYELRSGPEGEDDPIEGRVSPREIPSFVTATRRYTTIFNGSFASTTTVLDAPNGPTDQTARAGFETPNHQSHWIGPQPFLVREETDKFRMTLLNLWTRLPENSLGPQYLDATVGNHRADNPRAVFTPPVRPPSFGIGSGRSGTHNPYNRVIDIEFANGVYRHRPIENTSKVGETMRFRFSDKIYFPGDRNRIRHVPRGSGVTRREFFDAYLLGKDSERFNAFKQKIDDAPLARIYESGSIRMSQEYLDYTYDSPGAFFENELNRVLVAPSHSARIETKIQNVQPIDQLQDELNIPSVYEYYQSAIIDGKISEYEVPDDVPNELRNVENWIGSVMTGFRNAIDANIQNDNAEFSSSPIHKFPSDKVMMLEEVNKDARKIAENFVEISIKTRQGGVLSSALQNSKMDLLALEHLGQRQEDYDEELFSIDFDQRVTRILDDALIADDENQTVNQTRNDKTKLNVSDVIYKDFDKLIKRVIDEPQLAPDSRNLQEYPLYFTGWDTPEISRIEEAISSQIFLTQLNLACVESQLQRSYLDIIYGRKAYAETIGYKVEKYRKLNDGEERLVQTFLLMDNNSIDEINFIDSQVLMNQEYNYKIFTVNLIIGSKYHYEDMIKHYELLADPDLDSNFDMYIISDRMVLLNCAPFFEKKVSTKDRPPLAPQVSFLPFNGVDDKYNVLLDTNYGEREERPISIKEKDKIGIQEALKRAGSSSGKVLYKTDSLPESFEVFVIDFEPRQYSDFAMGESYRIPSAGKTGLFRMNVEPNKYYYYTFRTHDSGGFSNPTEVFKVRMVSYQNGIFMDMNVYDMQQEPEKFSLQFERFLHIKPNFMQATVNFSRVLDSIDIDSFPNRVREALQLKQNKISTIEFQASAPEIDMISLGNVEKPEDRVWDKKFKVRVKSKKTGKSVDLNISFSSKKLPLNDSVE